MVYFFSFFLLLLQLCPGSYYLAGDKCLPIPKPGDPGYTLYSLTHPQPAPVKPINPNPPLPNPNDKNAVQQFCGNAAAGYAAGKLVPAASNLFNAVCMINAANDYGTASQNHDIGGQVNALGSFIDSAIGVVPVIGNVAGDVDA